MFCDALLRMNVNSWYDYESGKSLEPSEVHARFRAFASAFRSELSDSHKGTALRKVPVVGTDISPEIKAKSDVTDNLTYHNADDDAC